MTRFACGARRLGAVALLGVLLSAGCRPSGPTSDVARGTPPRNVLLVTLDTTRADHLGCYGHRRAVTPEIDRLAREGTVFDAAYAAAPITLPSHTTLLTGLYPVSHGVRNNGRYALEDGFETLAELLRAAGFRTGAFVSAFVLDSRYGLAQGFEVYDDDLAGGYPMLNSAEIRSRSADETTDRALRWLETVHEERFFAWVHYFDPHIPYRAPPDIEAAFGDAPYDGQIAYVDRAIGRLRDRLQQWGILDDTLVVVTADHGEGLGDHGEATHGFLLYDSTLRVPLVMRYPAMVPQGRRLPETVGLVDVFPTIVEMLALERSPHVDGVPLSFVGGGDDDRALLIETVMPRESYGWADLAGVVVGKEKFIRAPTPESYDLAVDPGERNNLWPRGSDRTQALAQRFEDEYGKRESRAATRPITAEEERRLRSLGYVFAHGDEHDAKDPKDAVRLLSLLQRATNMIANEQFGAARGVLDEILKLDPSNYDALCFRGDVAANAGDWPAAHTLYERARKRMPRRGRALVGLGRCALAAGDLEEASGLFEQARQDPEDVEAHLYLAAVWFKRGKLDRAVSILEKAEERFPWSEKLHNNLGILYVQQDRRTLARRQFELALAARADYETARRNLALLDAGGKEVSASSIR